MKTVPLWSLTLVGLFAVMIGTMGCERTGHPPADESDLTPAPTTSPIASAGTTPFSEVAKHLDTGGSFYLFLSTERALAGLQTKADELQKAALASIPPDETDQIARAEQFSALLQGLLKESGIESLNGIGASSVAVEPDLYLNKLFVHHSAGNADGFVWNIFGESPHALDALELLPKNTAFGSFNDIDLQGLFQFIQRTAENSGQLETIQAIARLSSTVKFVTGVTVEELTASTGKEWGMILTLDPEKTVEFAVDAQSHSIPAPRAACLLRVQDGKIFNQVDQITANNPKIERIDEEGLKMRILPFSGIPELKLRITLAQWNGWLIVASHESVVREIIAAKDGGLRNTAQFKMLSEGLPGEGNGFTVATREFSEAVYQVQKSSIRRDGSISSGRIKLIETVLEWKKPGISYSVAARLNDGVLIANKGTAGASHFLTPLAIGARGALSVISKIQEKAKATKSLANARQIVVACNRYAAEHDGKLPKELRELVGTYIADGLILISPFKDGEVGYAYTPGLTLSSPIETVLLEDKFSPNAGFKITVNVDGSSKIEKTGP